MACRDTYALSPGRSHCQVIGRCIRSGILQRYLRTYFGVTPSRQGTRSWYEVAHRYTHTMIHHGMMIVIFLASSQVMILSFDTMMYSEIYCDGIVDQAIDLESRYL